MLAVKARPAVDRAAALALTASTTIFITITARKVLAPNAKHEQDPDLTQEWLAANKT